MTSTIRSLCTIAVIGMLATPGIAEAQLIPIKTTPIISGDSGMMLPSRTVGMGGVSIAVDDPLLDPFVNPAKGRRLRGLQMFIVPTLYTIDDGQGGGRTLSGGFTTGSPRFFAGGFFSYQNLVNTLPLIPWLIDMDPQVEDPLFPRDFNGQPVPGSYRRPRNLTWNAFWGFNLSQEGYSIGLSWSGSDTEQLEGYEYLYKDCLSLQHRGRSDLLRLGLFFEEEETGSAEFLLLLGRSDLTHYVMYPDFDLPWWMNPRMSWFDSPWSGSPGYNWGNVASNPRPVEVRRFEDQSRMVGLHLGGVRRLSEATRRLGWNLTWNWKKYPSIPEYELEGMNAIPRDPGFVHAFSAGFGLSSTEPGIYGSWEVNLQPVFLETWGMTDVPLQNWQGQEILPAGAKTIENSFRFLNGSFAFGGGWNGRDGGIQAGFRITSYNYSLRQKRNPSDTWEKRREDWLEFTPTWGGSLEFPDFQLQYSGYFRIGTGRPGIERFLFWIDSRNPMDSSGSLVLDPSDPIAAPTGKLVLEEHPVICHQISIVVPLKF